MKLSPKHVDLSVGAVYFSLSRCQKCI